MTLKALQNCLIIEPYYEKHDLFVLPHTEAPETGIVVAVGPDCKEIKVGDHVYYGVGQKFSYGKEFVVMREPHVLGVMNG